MQECFYFLSNKGETRLGKKEGPRKLTCEFLRVGKKNKTNITTAARESMAEKSNLVNH